MQDINSYFKYLYSLERSSMKYDLSNITKILGAIGNPHLKTKFIHIAGTNGKGGTASFLASILMEHGLKTGLFTSPHILKFNERIRINGKPIPDLYIENFLDRYKKLINKIKPSFFEVNTAIAIKYFADKKVDIAVIEAGLGGRLDSTNVITPEIIIITQIGIDHTDYLGNTLSNIAEEKLGIVKPGIDVIVSDTNRKLRKLFKSKIASMHLYFLDEHIKACKAVSELENYSYIFERSTNNNNYYLKAASPLPGRHQARNISAALLTAEKYLNNITDLNLFKIRRAIKNVKNNTGYRCRLEKFKKGNTNYILDISHNPAGIKSALSNLKLRKKDVIIFAMMNDKDYKSAVSIILKTGIRIILTQPKYKRAVPAEELFKCVSKSNRLRINISYKCSVSDAVKSAEKLAGKNGNVLVIGSFFLVSEVIQVLKIQKFFK